MSNEPPRVRLLTLNCWGLFAVSKQRQGRIKEIAKRLANSSDYDLIILQELWVESDYQLVRQAVRSKFPYNKRFYSGILAGPGLAVLSRWPIESSWLFRFPINGRPSAFWRGDWFVGKACGSVVISHPMGYKIEVLNAHFHAPYGPGDANYTCHRAAQAWEMSRIAQRAAAMGHVVLVAGDLNSVPGSPHYSLFEQVGGLDDAWVACHGEFNGDIASLSPADQIKVAGVTADSTLNTWRESYPLDKAKRLDYIFFDPARATPIDVNVAMTEKSPVIGSVSDHFGLSASFSLREWDSEYPTKINHITRNRLYDELLSIIENYYPVARWQSSWRNTHFWVSILALGGLLISVWWAAADGRGGYIGFIYILISILITASGLTDGFIGFLFGRNELRALREFEDEVWLAKKTDS